MSWCWLVEQPWVITYKGRSSQIRLPLVWWLLCSLTNPTCTTTRHMSTTPKYLITRGFCLKKKVFAGRAVVKKIVRSIFPIISSVFTDDNTTRLINTCTDQCKKWLLNLDTNLPQQQQPLSLQVVSCWHMASHSTADHPLCSFTCSGTYAVVDTTVHNNGMSKNWRLCFRWTSAGSFNWKQRWKRSFVEMFCTQGQRQRNSNGCWLPFVHRV